MDVWKWNFSLGTFMIDTKSERHAKNINEYNLPILMHMKYIYNLILSHPL